MISKILSVTVPIRPNETINPDKQVRDVLMREYSLSTAESQNLNITIRNLSLGVGALDDNHAISLQRINAYQPPPVVLRMNIILHLHVQIVTAIDMWFCQKTLALNLKD